MASDIVSALTAEDRKTIHDLLNNECTLRMSDALTDRFIDLGRVVTLRRRQCIIRRGDTDPDLYVIFEGIMRTWYRDGEQEVTQAFGTPGAICQSFHSYYNGEPSSVSFEACTPPTSTPWWPKAPSSPAGTCAWRNASCTITRSRSA